MVVAIAIAVALAISIAGGVVCDAILAMFRSLVRWKNFGR
jgi:hypothetical protein